MEIKVCLGCGFRWECNLDIESRHQKPCPQCGSIARKFDELCQEILHSSEAWEVRTKDTSLPSKKKERGKLFNGQQWSEERKKMVNKVVDIDRRQDHYHEKIIDPETGEVIHECTEPLSQHQGHGSAKLKKIT